MFGFSSKKKFKDESEAVTALMRISSMGFGSEQDFDKANMLKVVNEVTEGFAADSKNPKLFYWLGIAWRNFTAWHVRGDERKEYLEKSVSYYDKALNLSRDTLPVQLPVDKRHNADYLDQIDIAGDLGDLLVNEALIRDLDRAEQVLQFVYENTDEYEPCLCAYADLFYKKGDYQKCIEVAETIQNRAVAHAEQEWNKMVRGEVSDLAKQTKTWDTTTQRYLEYKDYIKLHNWRDDAPPAPLGIRTMAYRALGKQAKKDGRLAEAKQWFEKMQELGVASENDLKILEKLK